MLLVKIYNIDKEEQYLKINEFKKKALRLPFLIKVAQAPKSQ